MAMKCVLWSRPGTVLSMKL